MPTKNVLKIFAPDSFYHVYNRGWNRNKVFLDEEDCMYFEYLLSRYLSPKPVKDKQGREYPHFYNATRLNAYCLMGNHFHLLFYQYSDEKAISKLITSLMTSYTSYFNKKHKRRGSPFESTYKAVWVGDDAQLMHITRYIHLNHAQYKTWIHSSYQDYLSTPREWVDPQPILELFSSVAHYKEFVADYEAVQRERDDIKQSLYGS